MNSGNIARSMGRTSLRVGGHFAYEIWFNIYFQPVKLRNHRRMLFCVLLKRIWRHISGGSTRLEKKKTYESTSRKILRCFICCFSVAFGYLVSQMKYFHFYCKVVYLIVAPTFFHSINEIITGFGDNQSTISMDLY